jgi:large subunit ribosomal protein L13
MNTTVRLKASEITKDWHVIDAAGRSLGRVASEAAILLRGKHKPTFEPHLDGGDFVIIVNAAQVRVTGHKSEQINYYSHSGYPGGLKTRPYSVQFARHPDRVIEQAVWGMLPKGPLGKQIIKHLKVYKGPKHPHQSQMVGSDRARSAREAAFAESLGEPMKVPRLRPLGGVAAAAAWRPAPVQIELEPEAQLAPVVPQVEASSPTEAAVIVEPAVAEASSPPEAAVIVEPAVAEAPVEEAAAEVAAAPKRRTRKKAVEAEPTEATSEAPADIAPAASEE